MFIEFHLSGAYLGLVSLPLIEFTEEGYARISDRLRGEMTIRSSFVHFYEHLRIGKNPSSFSVRVDYLFSRTGERRAIWSDNDFTSRFRRSGEAVVPTSWWLKPEWATETELVHLGARRDASAQAYSRTSSSHDAYSHTYVSYLAPYTVVSQDVERWVTLISGLQEPSPPKMQTASIPVTVHSCNMAMIPASYPGERCDLEDNGSRSDSSAVWFLAGGLQAHESFVWKLEIRDRAPQITTYDLPHPYDLVRQGVLKIHHSSGDAWIPSEEDYQMLTADFDAQTSYQSGFYDFSYHDTLFSVGKDLIVETSLRFPDSNYTHSFYIHFVIDADRLCAVKELNIVPMGYSEKRDQRFANGHLISQRWGEEGETVFWVTNVHTGAATRFRVEVPESDLEHLFGPNPWANQ